MNKTVSHETRRADELKVGDWVRADLFAPDFDIAELAEILHVQPYTEPDMMRESKALLVYRALGDAPCSKSLAADVRVALATEAEVSAAKDDERRWELAKSLRALADLIVAKKLPVPDRAVEVTLHCPEPASVQKVAELLGVKVDVNEHRRHEVHFPPLGEYEIPVGLVDTEWYCYDRSKPASVTEMVAAREIDNVDEPEPIPDGVDGHPIGRPVSAPPAIRSDESIGRPEDIGRLRAAHEPEGEPVTRYFSFGHGQTDPATGENLLDKYVTVIAPTAEGCREAMLASRFGREWSMEYIPGRPRTDEWIPRWTEHDRIVVESGSD